MSQYDIRLRLIQSTQKLQIEGAKQMISFEETCYEEDPCQILPENLSAEDLEDVQEFLTDYDRAEMIEEYSIKILK